MDPNSDLNERALRAALAGRYAIERELGRGAMGIVYLARDLKHDRSVAVKVLRPDVSAAVTAQRFTREIRLTARLQHPNILPLFDSGEAVGMLYYVMPYVEGGTLRARLAREKQLPIEEAVSIARDVADALSHAHSQKVVHRDIKPENVLISGNQTLVADFGIARAIETGGEDNLTSRGIAVGTPTYMSPEQAAADSQLDGRSDIYSLGCVLYEMLAGMPPFAGGSTESVVARHLGAPVPPLRTVRPSVWPALEAVVMKSLEKVPADRHQTASQFAQALGTITTTVGSVRVTSRIRSWRVAAGALAAISVAVVAIVAIGKNSSRAPSPSLSRQITYSGRAFLSAISPDGQFLAYSVAEGDSHRVMVQDLASEGMPHAVAVTTNTTSIEWSPDGTRLLVGSFDGTRSRGLAFTVPRAGGDRRTIGAAADMAANIWAYWIPDGLRRSERVSLHTDTDRRLLITNLATGDTTPLVVRGNYASPFAGAWSPRGDLFAVSMNAVDPIKAAIGVVDRGGQLQIVVEDSVPLGSPRWSAKGDRVYYARGAGAIWRVPVSPATGKRTAPPEEVHRQLEILVREFYQVGDFDLTRDERRLAYAQGRRYANIWMVNPDGTPTPSALTSGTALRWSPVVSPDGKWIAFAQEASGTAEIFRMPITGGDPERITFGARVRYPGSISWSPDGKSIAFGSMRAGRCQVWIATLEGGQTRLLSETKLSPYTGHLTWAPGAEIAYLNSPHTHLKLVDPESGKVRTLVPSLPQSLLQSPQYSPDGKNLAVAWRRGAGDFGVWVFDVAGLSSGKRIAERWLWPSGWSADGRYIYANVYNAPTLYRLDTARQRAPEIVVRPATAWRGSEQNIPVREMQCAPAGRLRPKGFVCTVFDFVSDIWLVDNFQSEKD